MSLREQAACEAFVYGLPTVALYRVLHDLVLTPGRTSRGASLNRVRRGRPPVELAGLAGAVVGLDSSPFWASFDLRSGPVLLTVPRGTADRPVSVTLSDLYGEVLGQEPDSTELSDQALLLAGPSWEPAASSSVAVLRCRTDLCLGVGRARAREDRDHVRSLRPPVLVRAAVEEHARLPLPAPVPTVDVRRAPTVAFLTVLDWMLPLMPTLPGEEDLRAELELTGVSCGSDTLKQAFAEDGLDGQLTEGLRRGFAEVQRSVTTGPDDGRSPGPEDHLSRAARVLGALLSPRAVVPRGRSGSRHR